MWRWDQGRLEYFQFNNILKLARLVAHHNFKTIDRKTASKETGLDFKAPESHSVWRNYSRVAKLCLLVSVDKKVAKPTPIADILTRSGEVTCDEYLHFLVQTHPDPPLGLRGKRSNKPRYPLLFSLKYLLAKAAMGDTSPSSLNEILSAYRKTTLRGDERQEDFIAIINSSIAKKEGSAEEVDTDSKRQSRESLKVIAQISYLHFDKNGISVSLEKGDASEMFKNLHTISEKGSNDDEKIYKIASLFREGSTNDFNYQNSTLNQPLESGFLEGNKIKRTHIVIERNKMLRKAFFQKKRPIYCDICRLNTIKTYPWTEGVLELHHMMPLASGTRTSEKETILEDLVALCPNCHRAVHRYYDMWLREKEHRDFKSIDESQQVYQEAKDRFPGALYEPK